MQHKVTTIRTQTTASGTIQWFVGETKKSTKNFFSSKSKLKLHFTDQVVAYLVEDLKVWWLCVLL